VKIVEYTVVYTIDVPNYIVNGWQPWNAPTNFTYRDGKYVGEQAMVKYEEPAMQQMEPNEFYDNSTTRIFEP
jgi:hypothetical protein